MSSVPPGFGQNPSDFGQSPYQSPQPTFRDPYGPPPPSSGGIPWWVWTILGIVVGGGLLSCGCCGGIVVFGLNVSSASVMESLEANPVVEEHLGELTECQWNFSRTVNEEQDTDNTVFDVKGTKGSGTIIGELNEDSTGLVNGVLKTDTGTYDLFPDENRQEGLE